MPKLSGLSELSDGCKLLNLLNGDFGYRSAWDKKRCYFEKQTREAIENKGSPTKTNPNEPKNEAGKLLKKRSCGKNEPKNKPGHIVENK